MSAHQKDAKTLSLQHEKITMEPKSQSALGECCWAAYLKDGSLRENSPNF